MLFCPFHQDHNKPSAKIFEDPDGDKLYCFTEKRMYSSWDYIKKVLNQDPWEYLKDKVPKEKIDMMLTNIKDIEEVLVDYTPLFVEYNETKDVSKVLLKAYNAI